MLASSLWDFSQVLGTRVRLSRATGQATRPQPEALKEHWATVEPKNTAGDPLKGSGFRGHFDYSRAGIANRPGLPVTQSCKELFRLWLPTRHAHTSSGRSVGISTSKGVTTTAA